MLELDRINVFYGAIHALSDISLRLDKGELLALLGANGAGKTTILRTISGLLTPRSGGIKFEGREMAALSPHRIVASGIIHVPEGRQIFGHLTVAENLMLGAYQRRDQGGIEADRQSVLELFPILRDRLKQVAGTLSGGEQQMLAIGRALMGRPRLLLLDEPSLGLSPLLTDLIFEVIQKLHQQGITILLVEQNAYHALEVADRAYVMETGRVKLEGPSAAMLQNPEVKEAYLGG